MLNRSLALGIFSIACAVIVPKPGGPYDTRGEPRSDAINVHLIPHSHDDAGWLKTVDEYFYGAREDIQPANVQAIYDNMVDQLSLNKDRTFQVVEIAFFSRWWMRADNSRKEKFKKLVESEQITFLNGGWVMHDEACVLWTDAFDQMALGNEWINDLFGSRALPKVGWQIDPFGHSRFTSELFGDLGFSGFFAGRVDFQEWAVREKFKETEAIWARGGLTVFTNGYDPPHGFDWGDKSWSGGEPMMDDPLIGGVNLESRLSDFFGQVKKKLHLNNGGDVMFTMGSDFHYNDARKWFTNMDKLIHYSKQVDFGAVKLNIFYSSPFQYLQEISKKNKFPVISKNTDFFPYCDGDAQAVNREQISVSKIRGGHAFWTGYFASRTGLKRLVRRASEFLRSGELLLEICSQGLTLDEVSRNDRLSAISRLRDALATAQHHDAVSGTEKEKVADDYRARLLNGIEGMKSLVQRAVSSQLEGTWNWQEADSESHLSETAVFNPSTSAVKVNSREIFGVGNFSYSIPPLTFKLLPTPPEQSENNDVSRHEFPGKLWLGYYRSSNGTGPLTNGERYEQAGGAYIFRPDCPEGPVTACKPEAVGKDWGRVHARRRRDLEIVSHDRQVFQVDYEVGPIPCGENGCDSVHGIGKEVVLVFESKSFDNSENGEPVIYTDSQGRGLIKRRANSRQGYTLNVTDPVAGNFYPINTLAVMNRSDGASVSVIVDRAGGVGVLRPGELEIMIHRRLFIDDGRGVSEPLNQTEIAKGRIIFSFDRIGRRELDEHLVDSLAINPIQIFRRQSGSEKLSFSEISRFGPIPDDIALVTYRHQTGGILLRFANKLSENGSVSKFSISEFLKYSVDCEELAINGISRIRDLEILTFESRNNQSERSIFENPAISGDLIKIGQGEIRTIICKRKDTVEKVIF